MEINEQKIINGLEKTKYLLLTTMLAFAYDIYQRNQNLTEALIMISAGLTITGFHSISVNIINQILKKLES